MINDASFSFKCHYGASFTTAITPEHCKSLFGSDGLREEEKIQSLFLRRKGDKRGENMAMIERVSKQ